MVSNELLTVDLRLDSRVESVIGGEEVFFLLCDEEELRTGGAEPAGDVGEDRGDALDRLVEQR